MSVGYPAGRRMVSVITGALAQDIELLQDPDYAWVCSEALDLMPDGSTVAYVNEIPHGRVEPGALYHYWRPLRQMPVHPATLSIRSDVLYAHGGWMALPMAEDVGLLMAVSAQHRGYFAPQPSLLYRKSAFQVTARPHLGHGRLQWYRAVDRRVSAIEVGLDAVAGR